MLTVDAMSQFLESKMVLSVKWPARHDPGHMADTASLGVPWKAWENAGGLRIHSRAPSHGGRTGVLNDCILKGASGFASVKWA